MNMRPFLLLSFTVVLSILFSCKKEKLKSKPASFIVVNTTSVNSGTNTGMPDSHKITDIWLYVNEQFQGIYPIGSVMPILNNGSASIRMYGGIVNNGIAGTRLPYKFYAPYSFSGSFEAGKTYTITPDFAYQSGTNIIADQFDGGGSSYEASPSSNIFPVIINDPAKSWQGSAGCIYMTMTDSKPISVLRSSQQLSLPLGGTDIYLEMDYKCNQEISVGVIGGDIEPRTALTLRPTNGWNKIYISLTNVVSTQPTYNYYRVFVQGVKESGVATPEIYLDNLRLVRPL
jgi:hypothetical protein